MLTDCHDWNTLCHSVHVVNWGESPRGESPLYWCGLAFGLVSNCFENFYTGPTLQLRGDLVKHSHSLFLTQTECFCCRSKTKAQIQKWFEAVKWTYNPPLILHSWPTVIHRFPGGDGEHNPTGPSRSLPRWKALSDLLLQLIGAPLC